MFLTAIEPKYALLASQWSYGRFLKLTDSILFEWHDKSSPFNSTHYVVFYPQNGDRIVTIDSVTSLHPVCRPTSTRQWRTDVWQILESALILYTHLRKFRNFVFVTEVTIFSDHNPLMYLRESAPAKSAKLTRWSLGLQEFMHADSNIFHTSVVLFHIYRVYQKSGGTDSWPNSVLGCSDQKEQQHESRRST